LLLMLLPLAGPVTHSFAQEVEFDQETPVLLRAETITYDENLAVVTASGNVELSQNERVLRADSISYNVRSKVVIASGNVALIEPSGEVVFADFVELTDDLAEGFIRDIRVLMTDRTKLAAASGTRSGGNRTEFERGVFSPCELCREDPTRAPLWQIKAAEVVHDQEDQTIEYRDAWMEFFGVPVFYTPYFQHPDPTVERQSGFLAPTFGSSDQLGFTVSVPFFWVIAPNIDATFEPIITTDQGIVLAGEYRHLFPFGELNVEASATIADREEKEGVVENDVFRGHIEAEGLFNLDETWRTGFDINRTTDDTYLRVYDFSSETTLTSSLFAEGFRGRNYAAFHSYAFQGLRANDNNDETPIVLPELDVNYVSEPDSDTGSFFSVDGDILAITRIEGRDSRRLSLHTGWNLPYYGPLGDIYTLRAGIAADAYWVNQVEKGSNDVNPQGDTFEGFTGRFFPQLSLEWQYPWVRRDGNISQVITPIAQIVVGPDFGNPNEIPNEDSLGFEFDDTNLFSPNRFPGLDRVSTGQRVDYGLNWSLYGPRGGYAEAFFGQSFSFQENDDFDAASGLDGHFSDLVGRVRVEPVQDIDLHYRFRLDNNDLAARRNELGLRIGPPALNLNLGYTFVDGDASSIENFEDREELRLRVNTKINQYWSAFAAALQDLESGETREFGGGIRYQDECFILSIEAERRFFRDREIEPENVIFLKFGLKHLGVFGVGSGSFDTQER
jgi:LPS-assembly protein